MVKDLKAKNPDFSGRIAKITGSALSGSKKPPEELVEKLAGGVLMIEKAGEISEECAKKLQQALNQERWRDSGHPDGYEAQNQKASGGESGNGLLLQCEI